MTSAIPIISSVSTAKAYQNNAVAIYPNPARDFITIEYRTADVSAGKLRLLITDGSGRKLKEIALKGGDNDELIDIRFLLPGVYTISVVSEKAIISAKKITVIK